MKILLLSDNSDFAGEFTSQLRQTIREQTITTASWPHYTPALLENIDLVIVNVNRNVGIRHLRQLRSMTKLPILLISAIDDEQLLARLYDAGLDDHLVQPVRLPLLAAKLQVWQRWVVRLASTLYH